MPESTVNLAALLPAQGADLVVEERPVPTPQEGEVLIRNHALALNPVDWKRQSTGFAIPSYPTILGSGKRAPKWTPTFSPSSPEVLTSLSQTSAA